MKKNNPKAPNRKHKMHEPYALKKVGALYKKIDENKKIIELYHRQTAAYINLLMNFAMHDVKNAVHNMDGLVSVIDLPNKEDYTSLKENLKAIRKTLDDFEKINPRNSSDIFRLDTLFRALDIIHRPMLETENIQIKYPNILETSTIMVEQPYHALLQAFVNLIINASSALKQRQNNKKIEVSTKIIDDHINIYVSDNGCGIDSLNRDKIFDFAFSTTNGSGIGLTHTKYVLDDIEGKISVLKEPLSDFSTTFHITFPLHPSKFSSL